MFRFDKNKKIIIYGAGEKGKKICGFLESLGLSVLFIMDRNEKLWGKAVLYRDAREIMVWGLDQDPGMDKRDIVIVCTMENALQHEAVAENLYRCGYQNLIFLPVLHMRNEKSKILMSVYNNILQNTPLIDREEELPSYGELVDEPYSENSIYGDRWTKVHGRVVLYLPVELLYSERVFPQGYNEEQQNLIGSFGDTNIMSRYDYFNLWTYLETGEGNCRSYMQTHYSNPESENAAVWQRALTGRNELLALYDREFKRYINGEFFFCSPATGYYNPNGYITVKDGLHRITYLILRKEWEVPVEIKEEDYKTLTDRLELAKDIIASGVKHYIEHPAFFRSNRNVKETVRKFLFSIQNKYMHFRGKRVLIFARDNGYLLRNILRMGGGM